MPIQPMGDFVPSASSELKREFQQEQVKEVKPNESVNKEVDQQEQKTEEIKIKQTNFEECWNC